MGSTGFCFFGSYHNNGAGSLPTGNTNPNNINDLLINLEDAGTSEYFNNKNNVPKSGLPVFLAPDIISD